MEFATQFDYSLYQGSTLSGIYNLAGSSKVGKKLQGIYPGLKYTVSAFENPATLAFNSLYPWYGF